METWRSLLAVAIRTPSPHNVQPWRMRIVSSTEAELWIEKNRTLPAEDTTGSFIVSAMGMLIEGLALLAANRSLRLHHELLQPLSAFSPEAIARVSTALLPFARLRLEPEKCAPSPYADAIFLARRTSRIPLLPDPVPAQAVVALSELAVAWGQHYVQLTDPELIAQALECNTQALFADLNDPHYGGEITTWFRFTDRAARRARDGLDARCMNASPLAFWLAARYPRLLMTPIIRSVLKIVYRWQIGRVPTLGMLAGPFWDPVIAFDVGRFLLRFWLEVTRHGLYLHPFGNLVTNTRAAAWCREQFAVPDIWMVFKIGRSPEPPQSYRRAVEELLIG